MPSLERMGSSEDVATLSALVRSHELAYEKLGQELVRSQTAGAAAAALSGKALREARHGAQALKEALDSSQVENRRVKETNLALARDKAEAEAKLGAASRRAKESAAVVQESGEAIAALQAELARRDDGERSVRDEVALVRDEVDRLRDERDAVSEQGAKARLSLEQNASDLAVATESLDRASASQREASQAAAASEEALATLQPELEACRAEIETQKGELRAVEAMLRASKAAETRAVAQLVTSNTVVSGLELQLAALKGQKAATKDNAADLYPDDDGTSTTRESGVGVGGGASRGGGRTRRRPVPSAGAVEEAEASSEKWRKRAEEMERELARSHRDQEEALDKIEQMERSHEEGTTALERRRVPRDRVPACCLPPSKPPLDFQSPPSPHQHTHTDLRHG